MKPFPSLFSIYFGKNTEQQKTEAALFTMNQFVLLLSSFVKGPTKSFNIHAFSD